MGKCRLLRRLVYRERSATRLPYRPMYNTQLPPKIGGGGGVLCREADFWPGIEATCCDSCSTAQQLCYYY